MNEIDNILREEEWGGSRSRNEKIWGYKFRNFLGLPEALNKPRIIFWPIDFIFSKQISYY